MLQYSHSSSRESCLASLAQMQLRPTALQCKLTAGSTNHIVKSNTVTTRSQWETAKRCFSLYGAGLRMMDTFLPWSQARFSVLTVVEIFRDWDRGTYVIFWRRTEWEATFGKLPHSHCWKLPQVTFDFATFWITWCTHWRQQLVQRF